MGQFCMVAALEKCFGRHEQCNFDYAEIGENTIIGANSLVKTKDVIPANVLAMGSPAKVARDLSEQEKVENPRYARIH